MNTEQERVAEGVAYLDAEWEGWRECVAPSILSLTSSTECVWGQMAQKHPRLREEEDVHDYFGVLRFLQKDEDWAAGFGFAARCNGVPCICETSAGLLVEEWRRVLTEPSDA